MVDKAIAATTCRRFLLGFALMTQSYRYSDEEPSGAGVAAAWPAMTTGLGIGRGQITYTQHTSPHTTHAHT